jgi:1-acyl-sn-glycerol-3-phosphate acyltransferase
MAVANQVPLVPIAITGTHRLLPRGTAMLPLRSHVRIHVGEPIPTAGLGPKDVRPLTRRLREAIEAARANALAPGA